ncbi:MAG TPA: DnaA regulatory inactivator Hda [Gammaproteobacteria bacterium]|nr:DnaA regulatory inactivator Hda [Gammaproteobacteria bacterium]
MNTITAGRGQIPLALGTRERPGFDLFVTDRNGEALLAIKSAAGLSSRDSIYLWGVEGSGKSHLLQAACIHAGECGHSVAYIPLGGAEELQPAVLEDLDEMDLVCVDDIDTVAGDLQWEQPLLYLYNRLRDRSAVMIIAGRSSPKSLALELPDLKSRMAWGLVYHLQPLDDDQKISVLQQRAHARAFDLPDDVAGYLVRRVRRDLPGLISLLDQFEEATLVEKRKLTIPFVKSLLSSQ